MNAKRALELSKLDQENLCLKTEAWLKDSPQSTHCFRPYIKKSQGSSQNSCLQEAHTVGTFVGNTGSEGKGTKLSDTSGECTQTLLWVHQDNWQKELLVKYGNTITLIDATYKTTKYDLALFFSVYKQMLTILWWLNLLCSLNQLMKQLMLLQLSGSGILIGLHHSL